MTMTHSERKRQADRSLQTRFYYTYILEFDECDYYVGSTNEPLSRFTEHAINGSEATVGRRFTVRLVNQFETRKEAEYNEKRIQAALERGPGNVAAMIDNFNRIADMIRPQKTLKDLQREDREYEREMRMSFHQSKALIGFPAPAACGWTGGSTGELYATPDWEEYAKEFVLHEEGKRVGLPVRQRWIRKLCQYCVAEIPEDILASAWAERTALRNRVAEE